MDSRIEDSSGKDDSSVESTVEGRGFTDQEKEGEEAPTLGCAIPRFLCSACRRDDGPFEGVKCRGFEAADLRKG